MRKSGKFHLCKENATLITVYRHISFSIYSIRCGVLFICTRVFQNLYSDKRTTPHFLFAYNPPQ